MPKTKKIASKVSVHLIFNAHLDPVWLWSWESGLDAGLATFRSACDRLDEYPDLTFSAGDMWVLSMVERCDPSLFGRIVRHVEAGRWSLYGGWWVQPDCNIPTKAGFERQISLGRDFSESRFGRFTDVARNVDSFGHSAALPQILRDAGQPNYIMMRPGAHEKKLPARLFRWRGFKGSPDVLTCRIAEPYCWSCADERAFIGHILNAASDLPEGISDTLCFLGLGDHGGGPTIALINLCHKLMQAGIPGVELEFSTPERFFQCIRKGGLSKVPVFTGELQYHAIGCYTLQRQLKMKGKRAESLLEALELSGAPKKGSADAERLKDAWKAICFNQFHDIMGGTCIPSAYEMADAQVSAALAFAREQLSVKLRMDYSSLGSATCQRLVLQNPSDEPFSGLIETAPWGWNGTHVADENNKAIPFQRIPAEGNSFGMTKLLFRIGLKPFEIKSLSLSSQAKRPVNGGTWRTPSPGAAVNELGFGVSLGSKVNILSRGRELDGPQLQLIEDSTETLDAQLQPLSRRPRRGSAMGERVSPVFRSDCGLSFQGRQAGWARCSGRLYSSFRCRVLRVVAEGCLAF